MRLRFGGMLIMIGRRQLLVVGLVSAAALVALLHVGSQESADNDYEESVRPVLIEDVLRRRRLVATDDPAQIGDVINVYKSFLYSFS